MVLFIELTESFAELVEGKFKENALCFFMKTAPGFSVQHLLSVCCHAHLNTWVLLGQLSYLVRWTEKAKMFFSLKLLNASAREEIKNEEELMVRAAERVHKHSHVPGSATDCHGMLGEARQCYGNHITCQTHFNVSTTVQ